MLYLAREDGQGLVEYALIIGLVAVVVVVILGVFGQELLDLYEVITECLPVPTEPHCFGG